MSPAEPPDQRLEVLFEQLAELAGQRNAIDGRIVEIVAEMQRDDLSGATGARSVSSLVAWKGEVASDGRRRCRKAHRSFASRSAAERR